MTALHLSQQHKTVKRQMLKAAKQKAQDELLASFPQPRYFQVHFQHIHDRTDHVHQELAELKIYVHKLETKLDKLLMLLAQDQHEC